jgi:membrane protein YqaA with SNARE-associated domain
MAAELLIVAAVVFGVNIIPVFAPPTWAVLVYFQIAFGLPIVGLAVVGAVAALLGRLVLTYAFRRLGGHLPRKQRSNAIALGQTLSGRTGHAALFFIFAFSPLPSNALFEAAGLARLRLLPVAAGFLIGRLVSYTFFLLIASRIQDSLGAILERGFTSWQAIVLGLAGIAGVVAVILVDWRRVLTHFSKTKTGNRRALPPGSADGRIRGLAPLAPGGPEVDAVQDKEIQGCDGGRSDAAVGVQGRGFHAPRQDDPRTR